MLPDPAYITRLILRRFQGEISPDEEAVLQAALASLEFYPDFAKEVLDEDTVLAWYMNEQRLREEKIEEKVFDRICHAVDFKQGNVPVHRIHFLRRWGWVAASIILVLGIGAYLWTADKKDHDARIAVVSTADILPGKEGAILTLADGSEVVLDSLGNGLVAAQNGAQVLLQNGQLNYSPTGTTTGAMVYNTMRTPIGRQFNMTLPDGTQVWLNAASSISYPTAFTGKERKVSITGEAYFEVAQNSKMPFQVSVNNSAAIEVLGTHFNVNAYENEAAIKTTLLEGRVRVNDTSLQPGEQAQIAVSPAADGQSAASKHVKVIPVDIAAVMAWMHGFINFEGATFDAIMRQLERWYAIQVVYENNIIPTMQLSGEMTRDVPLNGLLKNLTELGVHYKLEGRKLIVLQ